MLSTGHIIVVLVVVLLLFGTKRLRNAGSDLGAAIKGFKNAMNEGEQDAQKNPVVPPPQQLTQDGGRVIDQPAQKQDDRKA